MGRDRRNYVLLWSIYAADKHPVVWTRAQWMRWLSNLSESNVAVAKEKYLIARGTRAEMLKLFDAYNNLMRED